MMQTMSMDRVDKGSGHNYTETTVSAEIARRNEGWATRSRPRTARFRQLRGVPGTRSLRDTAADEACNHLAKMPLRQLDELPEHVAEILYERLRKRSSYCFHEWKFLSKRLVRSQSARYDLVRYKEVLSPATSLLSTYLAPLTSPSFDFLACVSICQAFAVSELVRLSALPNLAVLEIVGADYRLPNRTFQFSSSENLSTVSDRLVKAWAVAAEEQKAFQVLRVLRLWYHHDVTDRSLALLDAFPALAVFDVRGCGISESVKVHPKLCHGWIKRVGEDPCFALHREALQAISDANKDQLEDSFTFGRKREGQDASLKNSKAQSESNQRIGHGERQAGGACQETKSPQQSRPSGTSGVSRHEQTISTDYGKEPSADSALKYVPRGSRIHLPGSPGMSGEVQKPESWSYSLFTLLSRIGQIRQDGDWAGAGITVGKDVILSCDGEVLNSVPAACLRVGTMPRQYDALVGTESLRQGHTADMFFMRLNYHKRQKASSHVSSLSGLESLEAKKSERKDKGRERKVGVLNFRDGKRQKLAKDVQSLFNI